MKDSTLVKICRCLSKSDLRALRKFVRSPYFNLRDDVTRLMDYLAENASGSDAALERERVFKIVFPEQKFDMTLLRYAMSFLLENIRWYLSIEELWRDGATDRVYLNAALKRRGADELVGRELPEALAANEKQPLRNNRFYFVDFQLRMEEFVQSASTRRSTDFDWGPMFDAFSAYHVIDILKVGCAAVSRKNLTQIESEVPFLGEALTMIEQGKLADKPAVQLWFHMFKCLESSQNEANFEELKRLLPKLVSAFAPEEIAEIYLSAINFCIKRLNGGEAHFLREAFDLYRSGLETGALIPNGVLSRYTYKNAMVAGARLKEDVWTEQYLETYKQYLPERDREDVYRFNLAFFLYFHRSDYDRALELLQQVVQFGDPLYNLDARRMLVRIFFETKAITALEAQLDSYRAYLRRHKEIGYHREHHLNFIQFVGKMIATDLTSAANRRRLRETVEGENALAEKDWLLKQLA